MRLIKKLKPVFGIAAILFFVFACGMVGTYELDKVTTANFFFAEAFYLIACAVCARLARL